MINREGHKQALETWLIKFLLLYNKLPQTLTA